MARNRDGSWTFFNRNYKCLGTITDEWSEWDDPKHKMNIKGLGPANLAKLDVHGEGSGKTIYFYNDGCVPTASKANMDAYLSKLKLLMSLKAEPTG